MSKIPRISVITTAYNVESFIAETMSSALGQSFGEFEYIFVDDGSIDRTLEIARQLASQDTRVQLITQTNGGPAAARNTGVAHARAEFIAFLDGDDVWHPHFLKETLSSIEVSSDRCAGVFTWSEDIDESSRRIGTIRAAPAGEYGPYRMLRELCPPGNGSCLLIKSSILRQAGPCSSEFPQAEDFDWAMRLLQVPPGRYLQSLPQVLVGYRKRAGSDSHKLEKRFHSLAKACRIYGADWTRSQRASALWAIMRYALLDGNDRIALEYARQGLNEARGISKLEPAGLLATIALLAGPKMSRSLLEAYQSARDQLLRKSNYTR